VPPGSTAVDSTIIDPVAFNTLISDLETDANTARPVVAGGTGATTAATARTNLGATAVGASVFTAADAAAARSAIGAMAQPTNSAGLGQIAGVYADQNTNFVAPSGGTWWGRWQRRNKTSLGNNGQGAGLYGGGTAILTCASNEDCFGDFIRIA
jgi:hypothetical protein